MAHATQDVNFSSMALADNVEKFQAKKIEDIKVSSSCCSFVHSFVSHFQGILYEMVYSELQYHAKGTSPDGRPCWVTPLIAMEILTNIQGTIFSMDIESDLYVRGSLQFFSHH